MKPAATERLLKEPASSALEYALGKTGLRPLSLPAGHISTNGIVFVRRRSTQDQGRGAVTPSLQSLPFGSQLILINEVWDAFTCQESKEADP